MEYKDTIIGRLETIERYYLQLKEQTDRIESKIDLLVVNADMLVVNAEVLTISGKVLQIISNLTAK